MIGLFEFIGNIISKLFYWVKLYTTRIFPGILIICIIVTLIGMATNFGMKMGISVFIFVLSILIAMYIIYGKQKFLNLFENFNSKGISSILFNKNKKNTLSENINND